MKYTLPLYLIFLSSSPTYAMDKTVDRMPQASVQIDTQDAPIVVHRHDLATHLGMTSQEAVFGSPRTFSSHGLDELKLGDGGDIESLKPGVDPQSH